MKDFIKDFLSSADVVRIGWLIVSVALVCMFINSVDNAIVTALFVALLKYINK